MNTISTSAKIEDLGGVSLLLIALMMAMAMLMATMEELVLIMVTVVLEVHKQQQHIEKRTTIYMPLKIQII